MSEQLTYEKRLDDALFMLSEADIWDITLEARKAVVKKQAEAIRAFGGKGWSDNGTVEQYLIDNGYEPKP